MAEPEFWLTGKGTYAASAADQKPCPAGAGRVKEILVKEAGGRCRICGYDRNMRALSFHHLDPSDKRHEINAKGVAIVLDKLRVEAQKCVLVCSNCHAEVEDGMTPVPGRPRSPPSG